MKYRIVAIAVLLCCPAFAQDRAPKFWDQQRIVANSVAYSATGIDMAQTCYLLQRKGPANQPYNWRELTAPTQSCGGIVAWNAGGQALQTGLQYWLYRTGHRKLSRAVPWISTTGSSAAILITFASKR